MRALLDVNVLVALLDDKHVGNTAALGWLASTSAQGWASCPLTENGCLRIVTNPRYPNPKSASGVLAKLGEARRNINHAFWPDDLSITDTKTFDPRQLRGHQQVTDIYLLALAVAHGGRLVTFDRRIQRDAVVGCGAEHLVVL